MSATEAIKALKDRIPFRDLKELLASKDAATTAGGWAALASEAEGTAGKGAALIGLINELYSEVTLAGTKDVFIFELTDQMVVEICSHFSTLQPAGGVLLRLPHASAREPPGRNGVRPPSFSQVCSP